MDQWDRDATLVQQVREDLKAYTTRASIERRNAVAAALERPGECAIINGSTGWGLAYEESDIDVNYYPSHYSPIPFLRRKGRINPITRIRMHHRFHDKLTLQGHENEPVARYLSLQELQTHLQNARETGEVERDLVSTCKLGHYGIIIGEELEQIVRETAELRHSLTDEEREKVRLDRLFESWVWNPTGPSMKKYVERIESWDYPVPESVIALHQSIAAL